MKSILKVMLGTTILAGLFVGCASGAFDKEAKAKNTKNGYLNPTWTVDGKVPQKVMVGQKMHFHSDIDTNSIPEGSAVNIVVNYDNAGKTGLITTLPLTVTDGAVDTDWEVKDAPSFYSSNAYSVPNYTFKLTADNGKDSAVSSPVHVYGWIHTQVKTAEGDLKRNQKVEIYKSDGTTISAKTDDEGYIDLKWLPLGKYSFTVIKDDEESAE